MSSRGATWRGRHEQRFDQKIRSRAGQRNRHFDKYKRGEMVDFPAGKLEYLVRKCREKVAHKSYGAAYQAKLRSEEEHGKEFFIYECPLCGRFHLTTHPWKKRLD